MANYYEGDDREDIIREQSETDPNSGNDQGSADHREEHDQQPDKAPPEAKTA